MCSLTLAGSDGEESDSDNEGGGGGANKRGGGAGAKRRGGKSGSGGGGSSNRPLSRPIICIANDLYAPQLRQLRDVARVFHFTPPSGERLAARLQQICRAEVRAPVRVWALGSRQSPGRCAALAGGCICAALAGGGHC